MGFLGTIDKKVLAGISVGILVLSVVALVFARNAVYDSGRTDERAEWLTRIANEPITRTTTTSRDTLPVPVQFMAGYGVINVDSALRVATALYDSLDELRDRNATAEEMLGRALEERDDQLSRRKASVVLRDSIGGKHEISYDFTSRLFSERYTMAPLVRELITIHERQQLPYEIKKIWTLGLSFEHHQEPGFGALAGVQPLILGLSYFPGSNTFLYRVQAFWEF